MWLPENAPAIKGLLIIFPGLGGNTTRVASEESLPADMARRYDFGVVGMTHFALYTQEEADYFLSIIDSFSHMANRPELNNIPFAMTGFSLGGGSVTNFNFFYPEKTIAYYAQRTHFENYPNDNINSLNAKTPALFHPGEFDERLPIADSIVKSIRALKGNAQ